MNVYAYGMCVWSTIHRIEGELLPGDGYGEIVESWSVPAGEAANGAILMSCWGQRVRLDGALLGTQTRAPLLASLRGHDVDVSHLRHDPDFDGFRDLVLTGPAARSVYGRFRRDLGGPARRWAPPDRAAIARARLALVDPCFGAGSTLAAEHCAAAGTPYVVLDCRHDSSLHRHAAATVLSREWLGPEYPGASPEQVLSLYTARSEGLTVLTRGARPLHYARGCGAPRVRNAVAVDALTTIGAGDAFRAGIAQGLLLGWSDDETVGFAARAAAAVCQRGPIAAAPPSLADIAALSAPLLPAGDIPRG